MQRDLTVHCILRIVILRIVLVAAAGSLSGCDKPPFELAPVHGTVTVDGRPITHGKVMFAPIRTGVGLDAGKPAIGLIRSDGSFVLSTYHDGDGAVVGEHWVTVFGPDQSFSLKSAADRAAEANEGVPKFERLSVTEKQNVKAGTENQITIALTSDDIAKYNIRGD